MFKFANIVKMQIIVIKILLNIWFVVIKMVISSICELFSDGGSIKYYMQLFGNCCGSKYPES